MTAVSCSNVDTAADGGSDGITVRDSVAEAEGCSESNAVAGDGNDAGASGDGDFDAAA